MLVVLELAQRIEHAAARRAGHAIRIAQIEHRILAAAELDALMLRGKESASPEPRVQRLVTLTGSREQHDEGRQIVVFGSDPVREPCADGGPSRLLGSGLKERHGRVVVDGFRVHRFHDAQLVDDLRGMGKQLADVRATLAVLREFELRSRQRKRSLERRHPGQALTHPHRLGQLLSIHRPEQGLVVEELQLRRSSALEQIDDTPDSRHEVWGREKWTVSRRRSGWPRRRQHAWIEERRQAERSYPQAG